jgi:hypothetical protein
MLGGLPWPFLLSLANASRMSGRAFEPPIRFGGGASNVAAGRLSGCLKPDKATPLQSSAHGLSGS